MAQKATAVMTSTAYPKKGRPHLAETNFWMARASGTTRNIAKVQRATQSQAKKALFGGMADREHCNKKNENFL